MSKKILLYILFTVSTVQAIYGQQIIETELKGQNQSELLYSFNMREDSYQNLSLRIEINSIRHYNRSSFISILTRIDNEYLEIGRFYLKELPFEQTESSKEASLPYFHEYDVCLWQKVLKSSSEIKLLTNGDFGNFNVKLSLSGTAGQASISVKKIIPLWRSDLEGFKYEKKGISSENLPVKSISLDSGTQNAFIQILVHGVAKNQNPSSRFYFLEVNGQEIAKRSIWREDCSYNPIYPQSDQWHKSRPNWCPGLRVYPLNHTISQDLMADGKLDINLRFQKDPMDNSGIHSYVVSAVLFVLEEPAKDVNVAITEILSPNSDDWHQRYNPICGSPVLIIKNIGKAPLKQITLNYGYNFQTDNKYRWKGDLGFMEDEIVYLPPLNWYFFEKDDEPESFTAIISSANGQEDAFSRGKKTTEMELADVYPYRLTFQLKTDKYAVENALEIFDDNGNPYFLSGDLVADSSYNFHVNFTPGCYEMILFDQNGNGIENEDQKRPVLLIKDQRKGTELKRFDGDFGGEIREQFMIFR